MRAGEGAGGRERVGGVFSCEDEHFSLLLGDCGSLFFFLFSFSLPFYNRTAAHRGTAVRSLVAFFFFNSVPKRALVSCSQSPS